MMTLEQVVGELAVSEAAMEARINAWNELQADIVADLNTQIEGYQTAGDSAAIQALQAIRDRIDAFETNTAATEATRNVKERLKGANEAARVTEASGVQQTEVAKAIQQARADRALANRTRAVERATERGLRIYPDSDAGRAAATRAGFADVTAARAAYVGRLGGGPAVAGGFGTGGGLHPGAMAAYPDTDAGRTAAERAGFSDVNAARAAYGRGPGTPGAGTAAAEAAAAGRSPIDHAPSGGRSHGIDGRPADSHGGTNVKKH